MTDAGPSEELAPVVAVIVTRNPEKPAPGEPGLETTVAALAAQDYPAMSILVVDAGSDTSPTSRVAAVEPGAFVKRLERDPGYGAAANAVLSVVEGASYFLFCHDDVAPKWDAVRLMVETAYRQNAGAVTPKIVAWHEPERLVAVGESADPLGRLVPIVDRNELDQGQHDGERDVVAGPGACLLVRSDLFRKLGGFDKAIGFGGETLDLCWRIAVAGARTVTAPSAVVADSGPTDPGAIVGATARRRARRTAALEARHRLRAALVGAGRGRMLVVFLAAAILAVVDVIVGLVARPATTTHARLGPAVWWNLTHARSMLAARRKLSKVRKGDDVSLRRLITRGGTVVRTMKTAAGASPDDRRSLGLVLRDVLAGWRAGVLRSATTATIAVLALVAIGSRHLPGRLPRLRTLAPPPDDAFALLRQYVSGLRPGGTGGAAPAPPGFALLGLLSAITFGADGLVWQILVLGALVLGIIGAARLARPIGTWRAGAAAVIAYAIVPVGYDSLAQGRMGGLVAYALAPWILGRLLRVSGIPPFGAPAETEVATGSVRLSSRERPQTGGGEGASGEAMSDVGAEHALDEIGAFADDVELDDLVRTRSRRRRAAPQPHRLDPPVIESVSRRRQILALSLLVVVGAALAPVLLLGVAAAAAALAFAGALVGSRVKLFGAATAALAAVGVAFLLLAPWSIDLLRTGQWSALTGPAPLPGDSLRLADLARFSLGTLPIGPLPFALLLAALLPVAIGKGWRPAWGARCLAFATAVVAIAWISGRGWFGITPIDPAVLLPFGAAAIALGVALGAAAYEVDLPGEQFGWRQIVTTVAGASIVLAAVPAVFGIPDGRWDAPERSHADVLSWMPEQVGEGPFRVLWIGDPDALPVTGWYLDRGLAFGLSRNGPPTLADQMIGPRRKNDDVIGGFVNAARRGRTVDLGRLVAPFGVRYVVIAQRAAPGTDTPLEALPEDVPGALRAQVDMRERETNPAILVFENAAWAPVRSQLPADALDRRETVLDGEPPDAAKVNLSGAPAVLAPTKAGAARFRGEVESGTVLVGETASGRWRLTVDGRSARRSEAFGSVMVFETDRSGPATLRFRTPMFHWLVVAAQAALLAFVIASLLRRSDDVVPPPAPESAPPGDIDVSPDSEPDPGDDDLKLVLVPSEPEAEAPPEADADADASDGESS